MNKKMLRIITILLTVVFCIGICTLSFAKTPSEIDVKPVKEDSEIYNVGGTIMGIIQAVAIVIAVIVLMILGVKYMMGSAQEKAEYKKTFIPYIVGAVLVFAAGTLANVVYQFASGINK